MAVTDFADLARDPESIVVGGRLWSPANLVAAVVNGLLESFPPTAGAVATYPACYSDKQLSLLRQALNLAGAADVLLIPEPVAAAEWLEQERGPLESGFVLVYDLGGSCLDVSMVRVGPDWDDHPIVGKSVRSYDFGGRPLGSMIARYARVAEPGDNGSMLQMTSIVDITTMRAQHIRDSLDVVHECVESTGRRLSDVSCILLVGGATRPVEVARILAELGRPVVMSSDPGQTVAVGAAGYAARSFAPLSTGGRHRAPKVAVFSSAAVASAVAVSAVTVFGGPHTSQMPSLVDALPGSFPIDNLLLEPDVEALAEAGSAAVGWATTTAGFGYSGRPAYGIAPVAYTTRSGPTIGPSVAEAHGGSHSEGGGTAHSGGVTYANPAQFLNPLPFNRSPRTIPAMPYLPPAGTPIPSVSLPGSVPAPTNSTPALPAGTTTTPGTGGPSKGTGVPGTGETSTGTAASGGAASDGSTGDASGGTTSGTSGSTSGNSHSGGSSGSTSGDAANGGASGGSTGGGSGSTGGGMSGRSTGGGALGGSTGGGASGGASGGGASGGASGGGASGGASGGGASGGSTGGGASGGASGGGASGGSTGGGASGGSTGGGASGGSTGGGMSGGSTGGGGSGSTGGGTSGGSTGGGALGGSTGGGMSGGSTGGGMSGGSTGGPSSNGKFSGGTTSGGSTSTGGASTGGITSHGSGGSGGGGGARR
ncbi:Hsp70 family protein [Nocardia sp. CA-135953]|uniref:Hsp70 family protein n=1 Tax=Nocardia sp. CA-135953 TaxID=3239978 RepID=UPI003D98FE78